MISSYFISLFKKKHFKEIILNLLHEWHTCCFLHIKKLINLNFKIMMNLKTGLFAIGILAFTSSYAQNKEEIEPRDKANKEVSLLSNDLKVTEAQKVQMLDLFTGIEEKNKSISKNPEFSDLQKEEYHKKNDDVKNTQLKLILSEEQFLKYTELSRKNEKKAKISEQETIQKKEIDKSKSQTK
jgi:hypothetical protein